MVGQPHPCAELKGLFKILGLLGDEFGTGTEVELEGFTLLEHHQAGYQAQVIFQSHFAAGMYRYFTGQRHEPVIAEGLVGLIKVAIGRPNVKIIFIEDTEPKKADIQIGGYKIVPVQLFE